MVCHDLHCERGSGSVGHAGGGSGSGSEGEAAGGAEGDVEPGIGGEA
jgi:hypothetical protein